MIKKIAIVKKVDNSLKTIVSNYLNEYVLEYDDTLVNNIELYNNISIILKNKNKQDNYYVIEYHNEDYFIGMPSDKWLLINAEEFERKTSLLNKTIETHKEAKKSFADEHREFFINKIKNQLFNDEEFAKNKSNAIPTEDELDIIYSDFFSERIKKKKKKKKSKRTKLNNEE